MKSILSGICSVIIWCFQKLIRLKRRIHNKPMAWVIRKMRKLPEVYGRSNLELAALFKQLYLASRKSRKTKMK